MNLKSKINLGRFGFLFSYIIFFCICSLLIRFSFIILSFDKLEFNVFHFIRIFALGYIFDLGAAIFMSLIYAIYLLLFPKFLIGHVVDKFISYFLLFILLFIAVFGFLAEFPFWAEFNTRFNFIAVDYLIYTFEVVENIKQSYPLPLIFGTVFSIILSFFYITYKLKLASGTFQSKVNFLNRLKVLSPVFIVAVLYLYFVENKQADWSQNIYNNELSKNGAYSFFAAFRSNELGEGPGWLLLSAHQRAPSRSPRSHSSRVRRGCVGALLSSRPLRCSWTRGLLGLLSGLRQAAQVLPDETGGVHEGGERCEIGGACVQTQEVKPDTLERRDTLREVCLRRVVPGRQDFRV